MRSAKLKLYDEGMSASLEQRLETKSFLAAWGGPHGHGRVVKLSDALAFVRTELEATAQIAELWDKPIIRHDIAEKIRERQR